MMYNNMKNDVNTNEKMEYIQKKGVYVQTEICW